MPNRFVWISEQQSIPESQQAEPRSWPQEVLDKHGLRRLVPTEAARIPTAEGMVEPRSTIYRAATLLIPDRMFRNDRAALGVLTDVLGSRDDGGVDLVEPEPLGENENTRSYLGMIPEVPRPAVLKSRSGAPPNAWDVLQTVRQAVLDGRFRSLSDQDQMDVNAISLEHALSGCGTIGPAPTSEPHPGTGDDETVAVRSGYGRRPVMFAGAPPDRPAPRGGTRRPVIAVIDTGYGANDWFGTSQDQVLPTDHDHFLKTFPITQELIEAQSVQVAGLTRSDVLLSEREGPVYDDLVSQRLAPAIGHGTFIAGLIRQAAPGANVLSIRALRADNIAYESDVLLALYILLAKQRKPAGPEDVVDVISLSLGYYDEERNSGRTSRIAKVLRKLTKRGVVVVAAAGNDTTARPYLPAALTVASKWKGERVIGVGALNTNGSVAWFSNTGDSVRVFAPGANLVSTFPNDVRGSRGRDVAPAAKNANPSIDRESFDPDDFLNGFASWSGTSFATPLVAAEIANNLIHQVVQTAETTTPLPNLDYYDRTSRRKRAKAAVKALKKSKP